MVPVLLWTVWWHPIALCMGALLAISYQCYFSMVMSQRGPCPGARGSNLLCSPLLQFHVHAGGQAYALCTCEAFCITALEPEQGTLLQTRGPFIHIIVCTL